MAYTHGHKDLPKEPLWAIIETGSTYVEGDERSRTNPGHGYPAHTDYYPTMQVFKDESEWQKAVTEEQKRRPGEFVACKIIPAQIETQISVSINIEE